MWFVANRCLVPMDETDLFYNLRLGDIILETHHVPRTNLLSFTNATYPDPNLAWLFQIVLSLAYRCGGIPGTVILKTLFVLATFGVLFRVALDRGAEPVLTAAILSLAAWAAEPRFVERPHLVTFLGLAVLLLAISRAESNRPGLLWAMVPLGLLWANGNSCFFLSPVLLLFYALGAFLDDRRVFARRALAVGTLQIPVLFATPTGVGWWHYVVNHFRMPYVRPLQEYRVAEWPLDGPFFFLAAAAVLCALPLESAHAEASARPAGWPRRARHVIPWIALAILASRRIRFVAEFSIVAGPWVAAEASARLQGFAPLRRRRARSALLPTLRGSALAGLALLAVAPRLSAISEGQPFVDLSMEVGLVPEAAIAWLNEHHLRDHLYNDLEVGSYLAWEGWPRHRVFQDPRINGYPEAWHAQLRRADLPSDEWEALLAQHNVDVALITFPGMNPRGAHFDPKRWALVYDAPDARIFVNRVPTQRQPQTLPLGRERQVRRDLIESNELPFTFTFSPANGVERVVLREPPVVPPTPVAAACHWADRLAQFDLEQGDFAKAAAEFEQALSFPESCLSGPPSGPAGATRERVREQAGTLALKLGRPRQAAMWLEGLTTPTAMINRGFALIQMDRPTDAPDRERAGELALALSSFRSVLAIERDNPEANFGEALSLARLGRHDEAAPRLRDFLEKWPKHFAAPQARNLLRDRR